MTKRISIGNGLSSTGYRTYRNDNKNHKQILVSWIQRRCKVCGRFLSKRQGKYCDNHGLGSKEYFEINKEKYHKWNKNWREQNYESELQRHRDWYNKKVGKVSTFANSEHL